jgi:hypothetical protein
VVVVVVVVLDGAGLSLLPHAAINVPSPISIAAGATATRRRILRREFLMHLPFLWNSVGRHGVLRAGVAILR